LKIDTLFWEHKKHYIYQETR